MNKSIITMNIKYHFDVHNLKHGKYSSQYFLKTQQILKKQKKIISVLQFSILNTGEFVVAGISECVQLLKKVLSKKVFRQIKIYGQIDGEIIKGKTGLLYIEGEYKDICIYENIIDGILNSRINVATNAYKLKKSLVSQQEIIYMADRTQDYCTQKGNGLAAYLGGIKKFTTFENIEYVQQIDKTVNVIGTIPHALIQQFDGNLLTALEAYINVLPNQKVVALIDYQNNVIESLNQIKPILKQIYAVRLDTSKDLIDVTLEKQNKKYYGVNPELVKLVRNWLDAHQGQEIKIIVSSGIDLATVKLFNQEIIKPDIFGIGSYFLSNILNITADLIFLNGKPQSKVGRYCLLDYRKKLFRYK